MFSDVSEWRVKDNISKYNCCDIKLNVLIEYKNIRLIGEIQFLLNWMLNAKKLGHSLYGYVRNYDLIKQISMLYYQYDNNKESANENENNNDNNNILLQKQVSNILQHKI